MTERRVRVVCPVCRGTTVESEVGGRCGFCWPIDQDGPHGWVLATLSDPEAEALMADGERYRNVVPEALAILENGTDYERLHVAGILRGTPTPEAEAEIQRLKASAQRDGGT